MERILICIKHNLKFLWRLIEWGNGILFSFIYRDKLIKTLDQVFAEFEISPYTYKKLDKSDVKPLFDLIHSQVSTDLDYFKPHPFDLKSLEKQTRNRAFLMMGTYDGEKLIGYFFLRFFINKKCFVGRLIDKSYRGKGIGPVMNNIMYETSWRLGFRCLSTISKNNKAVMKAHSKNQSMIILKELQNDYLLIEFKRAENVSETSV